MHFVMDNRMKCTHHSVICSQAALSYAGQLHPEGSCLRYSRTRQDCSHKGSSTDTNLLVTWSGIVTTLYSTYYTQAIMHADDSIRIQFELRNLPFVYPYCIWVQWLAVITKGMGGYSNQDLQSAHVPPTVDTFYAMQRRSTANSEWPIVACIVKILKISYQIFNLWDILLYEIWEKSHMNGVANTLAKPGNISRDTCISPATHCKTNLSTCRSQKLAGYPWVI